MTGIIGTIGMDIIWLSALMALGNYILAYSFCPAIIKNKILPDKFILQVVLFDLSGILNNTALQLVHLFKALVFKISAGIFTSNPSSTIHNQVLVFLELTQIVLDNG